MAYIVFLAAVSSNGVIGSNGRIPWGNSYPEDMRRFKEITRGYPVVMGRKTWDSLPKQPLSGRTNIVLTRNGFESDYCDVCNCLKEVIYRYNSYDKIYVIGGSQIFNRYMDFADVLDITEIHKEYDGDVYFPKIDRNIWYETIRRERDGYDFVQYERR